MVRQRVRIADDIAVGEGPGEPSGQLKPPAYHNGVHAQGRQEQEPSGHWVRRAVIVVQRRGAQISTPTRRCMLTCGLADLHPGVVQGFSVLIAMNEDSITRNPLIFQVSEVHCCATPSRPCI